MLGLFFCFCFCLFVFAELGYLFPVWILYSYSWVMRDTLIGSLLSLWIEFTWDLSNMQEDKNNQFNTTRIATTTKIEYVAEVQCKRWAKSSIWIVWTELYDLDHRNRLRRIWYICFRRMESSINRGHFFFCMCNTIFIWYKWHPTRYGSNP